MGSESRIGAGADGRARFDEPEVREALSRAREVDSARNLRCLAGEYLGMIATIAAAVVFAEYRAGWGLAWAWNVPVFSTAIVLIGGFQHRLAGLAHEASHYTLVRNKFWNDFLADAFCLMPVFSTVHFYRLFHMAHHQYTNDHERDPDLVNMGRSKKVDEFPMSRARFVALFYFRALVSPMSYLRYQWDYIYVNVFGKGNNVYMGRVAEGDGGTTWPRVGTILGLAYILGFNALVLGLTTTGRLGWVIPAGAVGLAVMTLGTLAIPDRWIFQSPFRQPYGSRAASVARLGFYTILLVGLAHLRVATGGKSALYVSLLWLTPMMSSFMVFMLLRDIYQHANADDGRLTNSRVFYVDPFTRWAVFIYGQDMHVTHHLFPAIPHYNLPGLHDFLRANHDDYAHYVVECRGTFANDGDSPTILDVMTDPRPFPERFEHAKAQEPLAPLYRGPHARARVGRDA